MKTRIFRVVAALASLAFGVGHAAAAALTGGGVAIELDEAARVTGLAVAGQALATTPAPFVELCNVATGHYLAGRLTSREGGLWHLRFDEARAEVVLAIRADDGALRLVCTVRGEPLPARGMLLRFNLPLDAVGWQWHSDMQQAETVLATKTYANVRPLRAYADLPEWSDQPDLRMGYSNRNFCTVLSGPVGLCLAVPMDRPCLFRTAYDAPGRRLEIVYDFALAAETRQPHQAEFAFDLYACDPAWGFRDALARYYALYPELFKVHIREQGQWMAFNRLSQIDNVNEFGFGLQEGASEPDYDDRIGVLSTTYFTHAGMGANLPDYDPEKDPLPPLEAQVAAVEAAFRRTTGQDGVFHQVGLHTAEGLMDVRKWRVYNHLIAQFNLDPELAYGAWTLKRALGQTDDIKARLKADLDGFYYDGLSAGVNYRTEHFATADAPCLWDPVAKKPFINNFFSSCEFARAAAELLRPRGQITMMNGAVGASFFVAPWLDVLGEETGLILPREGLNYIRATTYQKPFMTLLKGNYEQTLGHAEIELFMRRCLAYGIFPGFFDWPPSGLGPGGQYWNHPRYYERDRDLFRTYVPLCRALALAGWEPVTQARCDHPRLAVERFGPDDDGVVWLTILNEEPTAQETRLTIWPAALGLDAAALRATDILNDTRVALEHDGDALKAAVRLPADGVLALQLATPAQAARWRARAALGAFESGRHMRDLDRGRPARPVHWRAPDTALERADGGRGVVLKAETAPSMSQWVMLFQNQPRAVTLRVRAAAAGLDRPAGAVGIVCRKAWVSPSYTYYKEETFELPVGTYEARDLSFTITSEQPLRAIQVTAFIKAGTPGRLTLSELSMTDGGRTEVVVDPQFAEWYEPVPTMTEALTAGEAALGRALAGLADAAGPDAATQGRLAEAAAACRGLREAVRDAGAENGARRLLRDLDTIERHLGQVALAAFSLEPPRIVGPTQAVPGSTIALAMATPRVEGLATTVAMTCAGAALTPTPDGARLAIPATAAVGSELEVVGALTLGPAEQGIAVQTRHRLRLVQPLEVALALAGVDALSGRIRLRASLTNYRPEAAAVALAAAAPAGCTVTAPERVTVPSGATATAVLEVLPDATTPAGPLDLAVTAGAGTDRAEARLTAFHIPPASNRIRNPGFEDGLQGWGASAGDAAVDTGVAHHGRASLRLTNPQTGASTVSQSVTLNQTAPGALRIRAASRGQGVTGAPDKGYALYVDLYYTDGTPLYGQTVNFPSGDSDWQLGELTIEPSKPIRNVNVYLLLRGKAGTVWFDDVAVLEDPRRQGNLAASAQISVDSSFGRDYNAGPINDGLTEVEALHWAKQAWASAEEAVDHSILASFEAPATVARMAIHWSLDAGIARTSSEVHLQIPEGEGWKTVGTLRPTAPEAVSTLALPAPATAARFRVLQPAGKGPSGRPNLMWVRELELFGE